MLTPDEEMDFLRRQVLTSRNVTGGVPVGMLLGGLNWQIEHHLFPSMPRPNLRRAVPIVREFCEDHGLPYAEAKLYRSYQLAMGHLHDVGTSAGPRPQHGVAVVGNLGRMCRSIKTLRPPYVDEATPEDVSAAALQYVRKIAGMRKPSAPTSKPSTKQSTSRRGDRAPARSPAGAAVTRVATPSCRPK